MPSPHQSPHRKWQWFLLGFLGLLVFVMGVALSVALWVQSYVRGEPFRKLVAQKTSDFLKVEGHYAPFRWSGFSVCSDGFTAQGGAGAAFTDFRADQIRAEFNPLDLFQRGWSMEQLKIQHLQVALGSRLAPSGQSEPLMEQSTASVRSRTPDRLDVRRVVVQETNMAWTDPAAGAISQLQLTFTPDGQAWNIHGVGGRLLQKGWPVLNINQFQLRYQQPQLFVTEARFRVNDQGHLDAIGEVGLDPNPTFHFNLKFGGISVTPFLPEDWRARLMGDLVGEAKVSGPFSPSKAVEASGSVALANGRLEALPFLEQIAFFTRTRQFRSIVLQRASADFSWDHSKLTVTRFVAESERLLKVEGDFVVNQGIMDGTFRVGVTPSSVQWLPGAQSRVFTVQEDGYLWTTMRVTGPVEHPQEDLTPRLMAAARDAVVGGVQGAVEKNTKDVINLFKSLMP